MMAAQIGKQYIISGMTIEIIADNGDSWMTRNLTTRQTVAISKSELDTAIRLGKAEAVSAD
jgi:hypothetical protein